MARLTIANVAAPDLSGSARLLAGANESFNSALSGASSLLDKYNQGQQEQEDNTVLSQIAALKSEEELGNFLNSDAVKGRNFSENMRKTVMGLRGSILANNKARVGVSNAVADGDLTRAKIGTQNANTGLVRANTNSVAASTIRSNAAEGRLAADFTDRNAARDERRGLTPLAVAAAIEAREQGERDALAVRAGTATSRPAQEALQEAIKRSVFMDRDEADTYLKSIIASQKAGQTDIAEAEKRVRDERFAQNAISAARSPTSVNETSFDQNVLNGLGYESSRERLAALARGQELAKTTLAGTIAPPGAGTVGTGISDSVQLRNLAADREIEAAPQTRLIARAKEFEKDPVNGLVNLLDIGKDGQDPSTYFFGFFGEDPDNNKLRTKINDIARRANITTPMAASAAAELFQRNPSWVTNSVDARFPEEEIVEFAKTYLSQEALGRYDEKVVTNNSRKENLSKLTAELGLLKTSASKSGGNVSPTTAQRIKEIEGQLLSAQAVDREKPETGAFRDSVRKSSNQSLDSFIKESKIIEAIRDTPLGSDKRMRLTNEIMAQITNNQSLSTSEKAQLYSKILSARNTLK